MTGRDASMDVKVSRAAAIPSADEYAFALSQPFVRDYHWKMLIAHSRAPNRTMTAGELAAAAGYTHHGAANRLYGGLGDWIATFLNMKLAQYSKGPLKVSALAEVWNNPTADGRDRWMSRMYPEVADAVERLRG